MQQAYPFPRKWNRDGWKPDIGRITCRLISRIGLTGAQNLVAQISRLSSFRRIPWAGHVESHHGSNKIPAAPVPRKYVVASPSVVESRAFIRGGSRLAGFGEGGCYRPLLATLGRSVGKGVQPINKTIRRVTSTEGLR